MTLDGVRGALVSLRFAQALGVTSVTWNEIDGTPRQNYGVSKPTDSDLAAGKVVHAGGWTNNQELVKLLPG